MADKTEVEARIYQEKPDILTLKIVQWVENTAREDLSLAERVGNLQEIIKHQQQLNTTDKLSQTRLAEIAGLSNAQISNYMAVIMAPEDVKTIIATGQLNNLEKAALLAKITDDTVRASAIKSVFGRREFTKAACNQNAKATRQDNGEEVKTQRAGHNQTDLRHDAKHQSGTIHRRYCISSC